MLVLGVGFTAGAEVAGLGRVVETLVGAAVGVLVNVLFPPAVQTRHAGQAVHRHNAIAAWKRQRGGLQADHVGGLGFPPGVPDLPPQLR